MLAASISTLKIIMKVCEDYSSKLKINFNWNKSNIVHFGDVNNSFKINLEMNNVSIAATNKLKPLGNKIFNNK